MIPHFLADICGANSSSNCFLKILKYIHQKKRGVIFWEKIAFAFFWFSIKTEPTRPKPRVWEEWWTSWDSSRLALQVPKDHDKLQLRIQSGTQKMSSLRHVFLTNCSLYARAPLAPSQRFSTKFIPDPLGWIYNWFSATAWKLFCWVWLFGICIMKTICIFNMLFQAACVSPVIIPIPPHPNLENLCSEPVFLTLTIDRSHRKCSTVLWKDLRTQFEICHIT